MLFFFARINARLPILDMVMLQVPAFIRKGKDVQVTINRKHLQVRHRAQTGADWVTLVDDALTWDVKKEESMWTLEPGCKVSVRIISKKKLFQFSTTFDDIVFVVDGRCLYTS